MSLDFNRLTPEQQKYFDDVYAEKLEGLIRSLHIDNDVVRRSASDIAKWICWQHFEKRECESKLRKVLKFW